MPGTTLRTAARAALVLLSTASSSAFQPSPRTATRGARKLAAALDKSSTAADVASAFGGPRGPAYAGAGGTAVVTGGNSGIGACSVETLAKLGMNVVLCARDPAAGAARLAEMDLQPEERARVTVQALDLSDLDSVKAAAAALGEARIDVLLNNAGIMACPEAKTAQGFESQLGVNHVGHYYWTRLLLPQVKEAGRVVTVSSTAHAFSDGLDLADPNFENGRKYTRWGAYGDSKLANLLFAKGLSAELRGAGRDVAAYSLHPGVINTNLGRSLPKVFSWAFGRILADKTVEQGAATSMYACLAPAAGLAGGSYLSDCGVAQPSSAGRDERAVEDLWAWTEAELAAKGYEVPAVGVTEAVAVASSVA